MKRSERLFALAEHLRARRTGVTAAQLAERFGVTLRTIYRDLGSLRAASLPVNAERGRGGGYALDRTYSLPPVNFTAREAAMLVAMGRFQAAMRVVPFTSTLDSALHKVQAALSASSQRALLAHLSTLAFVGVPARAVPEAVRAAVERAWFDGAVLRVRYQGREGASERRVVIRQVIMERGETRLNCLDVDKGAERQFILHHVERASVEDPIQPAPRGAEPPRVTGPSRRR